LVPIEQLTGSRQEDLYVKFDGPLPKLCPAVVLSHQDGCHSAVALLLKAALIQVSDYRLLGASGSLNDRYAPRNYWT
jgi:hypothetical protein